jgi:Bacterial Ig domain/SdrD B-like domain
MRDKLLIHSKAIVRVGLSAVIATAFALSSWGTQGTRAQNNNSWVCFPSCSTIDGRMLALAGNNVASLAGNELIVGLNAAPDSASITISVFDGDSGSGGTAGNWDHPSSSPLLYELFADPLGDASGLSGTPVETWYGSTMANNAWTDMVPTQHVAAAQTASGQPYRYALKISQLNLLAAGTTSFKVRTDGTIGIIPGTFGFQAPFSTVQERVIYYPVCLPHQQGTAFDPAVHCPVGSPVPTTYDGKWRFSFSIPSPGLERVTLWDGDMDFGDSGCVNNDTNDADSPSYPNLSPEGFSMPAFWFNLLGDGQPIVRAQAIAGFGSSTCASGGTSTGQPADNTPGAQTVRLPSKGVNVNYDVVVPTPTPEIYTNWNPSGNREWEKFTLDADPLNTSNDWDYKVQSLPGGIYHVDVDGMDIGNLNSWYIKYRLLGATDCAAPPCQPVPETAFYLIERYVWYDTDKDGRFDTDESGIPGVVVFRTNTDTQEVVTAVTDSTGMFSFRVPAGNYSLEVVPSNFAPTQPLNGLYFTGNNGFGSHTGEVAAVPGMGPDLTYDRRDFGYVRNTPPTAFDDGGLCLCTGSATFNVLANDTDVDVNDTLTLTSISQPTHGTATMDGLTGTVTYTATVGYLGADSFTYTATDGSGATTVGTVTLSVINNPPVLLNDSAVANPGSPVTVGVLANDSDPDGGQTLTVASATNGTNGTTVVNLDGTITYTPNPGFSGTDTFSYTVSDKCGQATAMVTITVNAPPPPPPPPVCDARGYTTYTPGGWGAKPSGNNPGMLLRNNFSTVYPGGFVTIGSGAKVLKFTSAAAIETFLPLGGNPGVLSGSATNPTTSVGGPFIGHLLSLQLAADFSRRGALKVGLGNMAMLSGPLAGRTVDQILALANGVAGGTVALPSGVSFSTLHDTLVAIIMNYHEGTTNGGLLGCGAGDPPPPPCVATTFALNQSTSGSIGNTRTFSVGGVSVKATAFSRTKVGSSWATANLGAFGAAGLGVTDGSEGTGANNTHTVDNGGDRHNYIVFAFSQPVTVTSASFGYVVTDSDAQVWIGTIANAFNTPVALTDAVLTAMGSPETVAGTTATGSRAFNAGREVGNVVVVAADTAGSNDFFKLASLSTTCVTAPPPPPPPPTDPCEVDGDDGPNGGSYSDKSDKSGKSNKSSKSGSYGKSSSYGKSGGSSKSDKSSKSSSKSEKSDKDGSAGDPCDPPSDPCSVNGTSDKSGKSNKSSKSSHSYGSSNSDKSGKSSKSSKSSGSCADEHSDKSTKSTKSTKSNHYQGDGDDHDKGKNGHKPGDGCSHDSAVKPSKPSAYKPSAPSKR